MAQYLQVLFQKWPSQKFRHFIGIKESYRVLQSFWWGSKLSNSKVLNDLFRIWFNSFSHFWEMIGSLTIWLNQNSPYKIFLHLQLFTTAKLIYSLLCNVIICNWEWSTMQNLLARLLSSRNNSSVFARTKVCIPPRKRVWMPVHPANKLWCQWMLTLCLSSF